MQVGENDVMAACQAALALTNPEDDRCVVPMRHAAGSIILREIAMRVLQGELAVVRNEQQPPAPPGPPLDIK